MAAAWFPASPLAWSPTSRLASLFTTLALARAPIVAWLHSRVLQLRCLWVRLFLRAEATPPKFCIQSANHRRWLTPKLERHGWQAGDPADAVFLWHLTKKLNPQESVPVFNGLPNLLLLDDKAVLALLTRRFSRTRPLVTYVVYGEWDDTRVRALRERWADPACDDPRWWIIKDAHASNGFSAALFDRSVRPFVKKDVAGGYCYVVQEYVERPMLIDGRKFEMRQYVLMRGDGAAFTYDGALIRLSCVPYDLDSRDPRVHITNKYVQTGWEAQSSEGRTLDDIERVSHDWPMYSQLLTKEILPLIADLVDSVAPMVAPGHHGGDKSGQQSTSKKAAPINRSAHFELFACDLMVSASGRVHLMEVNINCAFGTFHPRTQSSLIDPMFEDLLSLCLLPAAGGVAPSQGRWLPVRQAGFDKDTPSSSVALKELQEHQMYVAFKKSSKKRYERQFARKEFLLSDVDREETPTEQGKCTKCGYFACVCGGRRTNHARG